jgi:hypothetical protein
LAEYPCDLHLARYRGPSTRCFLNLYRDDQACFFRVSVCEDCIDELVKPWLERGLIRTDQGVWDPLDGTAELQGLWQAQEQGPRLRLAPRRP